MKKNKQRLFLILEKYTKRYIEFLTVQELKNFYEVTGVSKTPNANIHINLSEDTPILFYVCIDDGHFHTSSDVKLVDSQRWKIQSDHNILQEIYAIY